MGGGGGIQNWRGRQLKFNPYKSFRHTKGERGGESTESSKVFSMLQVLAKLKGGAKRFTLYREGWGYKKFRAHDFRYHALFTQGDL